MGHLDRGVSIIERKSELSCLSLLCFFMHRAPPPATMSSAYHTRYEKPPYWHFFTHIGPNMGFQYGFFPILERQYGNDQYGVFSANMGVLLPIWEVYSHIGYFWDLLKDYFSVSRVCIPIWDSISNMGNIFPIWIFFKVMSQLIFYLYQ